MVAGTPRLTRRLVVLGALALLLGAIGSAFVMAQARDEPTEDGLYITVPNPINEAAVRTIQQTIDNAVNRDKRKIRTIVFDFNPDGQASGTSNVNPCIDLKNLILDLRLKRLPTLRENVRTVAYVSNEVKRHTVLPVMACDELVMSQEGKVGQVLGEKDPQLTPEAKTAYQEVAKRRGEAYEDVVLKMTDRDMVIVKTKPPVRFVSKSKVKEEETDSEPPGLGAGIANTLIDANLARKELQLCKAIYNRREHVVEAYRLPANALDEDLLFERPVVWRIDVRSAIDKGSLSSLERRLRKAVGRKANVIILYLDSEGGDTTHAQSTANLLRELHKKDRVKTIAYIPPKRSAGASTFLALGSSEIVMASDAYLGDFNYLREGPVEKLKEKLQAPRNMLLDLAAQRGRPRALFAAMLDPEVVPYRVQHKHDLNYYTVKTDEELQEEEAAAKKNGTEFLWKKDARMPIPQSEFLKLDAKQAQEWRIVRYNDVESFEQLCSRYNFDTSKVELSRDDWFDHVAEFFRNPIVQIVLIMVGIAGLILELKMPGLGIPGIVAALCFVLFFWSNSFHSDFTMLAVFLFILGLVLIGLEIFVIPGFGITGISGVLLLVGSLVLVTLERLPETHSEWMSLGGTLMTFGVTMVVAIVGAFLLARNLPSIPYASRLMLSPPSEGQETSFQDETGDRKNEPAALLGAIGVASTPLRPAGKARFGDDFLDVMAEGDFVNAGSRVQVIEIEGKRIVVKEV